MKIQAVLVMLLLFFLFSFDSQAVMPVPLKPPCQDWLYTGGGDHPDCTYHAGFCSDNDKKGFWFYQHEIEPYSWMSSADYDQWLRETRGKLAEEAKKVLLALKAGTVTLTDLKFEVLPPNPKVWRDQNEWQFSFTVDAQAIGFKTVNFFTYGFTFDREKMKDNEGEVTFHIVFADREPGAYSHIYLETRARVVWKESIAILDVL